MTRTVTFTLPIPPSTNRLWRGTGVNKSKTAAYSQWLDEAGWRINVARSKGARNLIREQWYWTDIRLPQSHLGDSDNRIKAIHDLLHGMSVTPDDKWLLGGTYMRCAEVEPGTCAVTATTMDSAAFSEMDQILLIASRLKSSPASPIASGVIS